MKWLLRFAIAAILCGVGYGAYRVNTTRPALLAQPTSSDAAGETAGAVSADPAERMTAEQALRAYGAPEAGHTFAETPDEDGPFRPEGPPRHGIRAHVREKVGRALDRSYERASGADDD